MKPCTMCGENILSVDDIKKGYVYCNKCYNTLQKIRNGNGKIKGIKKCPECDGQGIYCPGGSAMKPKNNIKWICRECNHEW